MQRALTTPGAARWFLLAGLVVVLTIGLLWLSGGLAWLDRAVFMGQKSVQNGLASGIRAVRAGQPGALLALSAAGFAYGIVHAAGPGHGKLVLGGYALSERATLRRLVALSFAASLAQAGTAIVLVLGGFWLLGWGRAEAEGAAREWIAPLGALAVGAVGLWLALRGARRLWAGAHPHRLASPHDHHAHDHHDHGHHDHDHGPDGDCGHAHGPSLEEVRQAKSWRESAALIGAIALRPCSGALLVLVLAVQFGIPLAGVMAAVAMGIGTGIITASAALLALWGRAGAFQTLSGPTAARALPLFEIAAGALVILAALALWGRSG